MAAWQDTFRAGVQTGRDARTRWRRRQCPRQRCTRCCRVLLVPRRPAAAQGRTGRRRCAASLTGAKRAKPTRASGQVRTPALPLRNKNCGAQACIGQRKAAREEPSCAPFALQNADFGLTWYDVARTFGELGHWCAPASASSVAPAWPCRGSGMAHSVPDPSPTLLFEDLCYRVRTRSGQHKWILSGVTVRRQRRARTSEALLLTITLRAQGSATAGRVLAVMGAHAHIRRPQRCRTPVGEKLAAT